MQVGMGIPHGQIHLHGQLKMWHMDRTSPSGTEGTALLAHEACHNNHPVLVKGMLLDDAVQIVIIGKLVTPAIQAARNVPAAKVIVSDIQDAYF